MVPKQFHQWLKVFGKVELERMPVWKVWDHAIDVKEDFKPSKAKVYPIRVPRIGQYKAAALIQSGGVKRTQ